jgi:hypothetical protein
MVENDYLGAEGGSLFGGVVLRVRGYVSATNFLDRHAYIDR